MSVNYRIVRRAFSKYETVAEWDGSYLQALEFAMLWEHEMKDGEYLVRREDEPNHIEGGYINQGNWD